MDSLILDALLAELPGLDALLRAEGIRHGADAWLAVHALLRALAGRDGLPSDPRDLEALLAPLLCKSAAEQARFGFVFRTWLNGAAPPRPIQIDAPGQPGAIRWRGRVRRFDRRARLALVGLTLAAVLGLALAIVFRPVPAIPSPTQQLPTKPPTQPSTALNLPVLPETHEDWPPPNLLPTPPEWADRLRLYQNILSAAPALVLAVWLAWRYRRRTVLRRDAPDGETLLNRLRIAAGGMALFGDSASAAALRSLKAPSWTPSRLDINATARATARHCGWFSPRYRRRRVAPEYLLLVRSLQREDHGAGLAEELARRFEEAGVELRHFRFRDDPRRLIPWDGGGGQTVSLERLAEQHGEARLLVLGDFDILFHPLTGQPRPWLKQLERWPRRVWLNPGAGDARLWRRGFLLLPLRHDSLGQISRWLESWQPLPPVDAKVPPLPAVLAADPHGWLASEPPGGVELAALCLALRDYFGDTGEGFLLLQALAVYPEPYWNLSLALDFLLFGQAEAGGREERLLRLARLPWLRQGFMPEYLREHWVRLLPPAERKRVRGVYTTLLSHLTEAGGGNVLELPIATPAQPRLLRDLLRRRRDGGHFDDPIFAAVLLGKKLGFLDFDLPRALERVLPGGRFVVDLAPVVFGALLAGLATWGGDAAWNRYGRAALLAQWRQETPLPARPCDECPELIPIPGGEFWMGSGEDDKEAFDNEKPRHKVTVKPFSIGQYEVTQGQWKAVMGSNPSYFKQCGDDCPVEQVSFDDVQTYISKLNAQTGETYRLPTEAEWEYACRAGGDFHYCGGNDLDAMAWYGYETSGKATHPVGRKQDNAWGLYDMSGNVWEWTCSAYTEHYDGSERKCADSGRRAVRGGSWFNRPRYARSANRSWNFPSYRYYDLGFRLAQD